MMHSFDDLESDKMELILEKIVAPSPTGSLRRPRLMTLLSQSVASCTSTILSGRAGTGKTVLALDFAEDSPRTVCWYKVDAPDSELRLFLRYLIASLRIQRPSFGKLALIPLLHQATLEKVPLLAEAFVYELEKKSGSPLLIIIEDLHLVCDAQWLVHFFRRLLPLLPSDVHMLITSRTLPPAPLWRMRSKQTLSVIEEGSLAFTRDEAIALFQSYGLSRDQASIALDHSQGRAAALSNIATTLCFAEVEVSTGSDLFNAAKRAEAC